MKFRIKILAILILLISVFVWFDQSRSFYYLSEKQCFTVWKRLGNKCYIVSGKYFGIIKPSRYIKTTNDNALTIIDVDSSDYKYAVSNDYGKNVKIDLDQKTEFFDYNERKTFVDKYYVKGRIRGGLKYLMLDLKENLVVVNGIKQ